MASLDPEEPPRLENDLSNILVFSALRDWGKGKLGTGYYFSMGLKGLVRGRSNAPFRAGRVEGDGTLGFGFAGTQG